MLTEGLYLEGLLSWEEAENCFVTLANQIEHTLFHRWLYYPRLWWYQLLRWRQRWFNSCLLCWQHCYPSSQCLSILRAEFRYHRKKERKKTHGAVLYTVYVTRQARTKEADKTVFWKRRTRDMHLKDVIWWGEERKYDLFNSQQLPAHGIGLEKN